MTLRTSLFNKGIYKSTLRRFWWGSAFYFVILFMLTSMMILMNMQPDKNYYNYYDSREYLMTWEMLIPGLLVGVVVVTVTAMLVYRFVHSRKQSVFVHSLPVSREANYISTVLGGLTLMAAPIVLNGIILMIISACGYGELFNIPSCFWWMGKNLLGVFVLFAYSTFAAMLTGNTFAVLVLNVVIYIFLPIVAAGIEGMLGTFIYGYGEAEALMDFVARGNPVLWTVAIWGEASYRESELMLTIYQVFMALVLYAASYFIYKKRRMESAEEVAAFARLKPVYKYMLTLLGALGAFLWFSDAVRKGKPVQLIFGMLLTSAVVYFGSEMALKKTLKVWKSYKGYLVFAGVFGAVVSVMAFTSFFGFETRIPDMADVESAAIYKYKYSYYAEEPFSTDEALIEGIIETHRDLVEKHVSNYVWGPGVLQNTLNIKYKLKNGNTMYRFYKIDTNTAAKLEKEIYQSSEYKKAQIGIFSENVEGFDKIVINKGTFVITDRREGNEFIECLRRDIEVLDYDQIESQKIKMCDIPVNISYELRDQFGYSISKHVEVDLNVNFKNTVQWLRDNGYWDSLTVKLNQEQYIFTNWGGPERSIMTPKAFYRITTPEDLQILTDFIYSYEIREEDKKYYSIGWKDETGSYKTITNIDEDALELLLERLEAEEAIAQ